MILRYVHLRRHPDAFRAMTGLRVAEFDALWRDLRPAYERAEVARLTRPTQRRPSRQRAIGAGHRFTLDPRDQVLLTVVWLRQYPTQAVLGYLVGIDPSSVSRAVARLLPLLEQAGVATMARAKADLAARAADPAHRQRSRRSLDALLRATPALAVLVDTFEQRVQRPQGAVGPDGRRDRQAADAHYSGKKKQHTLKSQVTITADTHEVLAVPESAPGPTSDVKLLETSGVLDDLPPDVGALGDKGYVSAGKAHPRGPVATPRKKPRNQPRPPEDVAYNAAFARRRVPVEHTIGRMRRYQAITQPDRHHRRGHTARTRAIAGLANRQLRHRFPHRFAC